MSDPRYLYLKPGDTPPELEPGLRFKAVVVVEAEVTPEWRDEVSAWLVRSGCRSMMAWGRECDAWHASVDLANMEQFNFQDIPEADLVMTTSHAEEPLE